MIWSVCFANFKTFARRISFKPPADDRQHITVFSVRCWTYCQNRVVQKGMKFPLQVFRTKHKGKYSRFSSGRAGRVYPFFAVIPQANIIAAEHRRRSETYWSSESRLRERCPVFVIWQVMANCNADRKWVWFTQTAVRARCFCCQSARLPSSTLLAQLAHHSPGPRIALQLGPLHSHVLLLFAAMFSVASCVMRRSTSLLLENY